MSLYKIDDVVLPDHHFLTGEDLCFYLLNYKPNSGFEGGATNSMILNFKKSLERQPHPDYYYKGVAITQISGMLARYVIPTLDLANSTLIPIPPSKTKQNPLFDNRMTLALQRGCRGRNPDIRELLIALQDSQPIHISDNYRDPEALYDNLGIDPTLTAGLRNNVILFDDVITTGAHYLACKRRLLELNPDLNISGIFVARREPTSAANDFLDQLRKEFG
jgi:hypothetical protein